jgi:anti-anti-sigma factor
VALRMSPEREPSRDGVSATTVQPVGPFAVSTVVVGTTAVLSLEGRVDLSALPACRHAVDELLRDGVTQITVDLQVAHFDDESIALLALMRRYALRHRARLALADIPPHVARVLERTGVSWLYRPDGSPEDPDDQGPLRHRGR